MARPSAGICQIGNPTLFIAIREPAYIAFLTHWPRWRWVGTAALVVLSSCGYLGYEPTPASDASGEAVDAARNDAAGPDAALLRIDAAFDAEPPGPDAEVAQFRDPPPTGFLPFGDCGVCEPGLDPDLAQMNLVITPDGPGVTHGVTGSTNDMVLASPGRSSGAFYFRS